MLTLSVSQLLCCSEYFKAYDDGDTARLKELAEKYDLLISRMKKYKYNISSIATIYQMRVSISDNLEDEARTNWLGVRGELPGGADTRPINMRVKDEYCDSDRGKLRDGQGLRA